MECIESVPVLFECASEASGFDDDQSEYTPVLLIWSGTQKSRKLNSDEHLIIADPVLSLQNKSMISERRVVGGGMKSHSTTRHMSIWLVHTQSLRT